jgi:hypothetical protein
MPRDEKQIGKVPCPICSLSPPQPSVEPDPAGWGVDGGPAGPESDGPPPRPRAALRAGGGWKGWAAAGAGLLLLVGVGGAVLMLRGGTGQLLVTGGADGVEVVVRRDGKDVATVSPAANKPIDLKPGTYELAVKGPGGWRVDAEQVTVARGAEVAAKVERGTATGGKGGPAAEAAAPAGGPEVLLVGKTALAAAAFGKSHVCAGGSDYTVTLPPPAGNAGRTVWVRMSPALTRFVTLDAGAGATIDGQQTRVMWAQEAAQLVTDGANWFKVAGKTRPMGVKLQRQGPDQEVPGGAYAPAAFSTFVSGVRAMFDPSQGRAVVVRPGTYQATAFAYAADGSSGRGLAVGAAVNAADNKTAANNGYAVATASSGATFVNTFECNAGDYVTGWYYAFGGDVLVLGATAGSYPQLVLTELPSW